MKTQKHVNRKKGKQGNSRKLWLAGAAAGLVVLAGAAGSFGYKFNTSDVTVAQGNQAFAAQEYDAALEKYQSAQQNAPIFAEPFYNAANVLYKQSKFQEAQPLLEEALARSNDKIAEFIRFNLGNIAFNAQQFDMAIEQYQDALRLNPEDKDAKYNLELALLQQQQQNQDQQNQDQQNQDQQNQDQQNQDQENKDQQNQDQQGQDQQNQDQQGQEGQDQQDQQGQQGQDQQQQQAQEGQDQQDQQGQESQDQQDQQGQQGQDQQQQQGQGQDQQQQGQQGQDQQQQGAGGQGEPTDEPGQEEGYTYVPGQLTEEQAEQMLAAVGGNSQTLMEKLQQYLYVPGGTVEKDW